MIERSNITSPTARNHLLHRVTEPPIEFDRENAKKILGFYEMQFQTPIEEFCLKKLRLRVPLIPVPILWSIVREATNLFKQESMVLTNLTSPLTIVGDLNGHLCDLLRIIQKNGSPDKQKYLFLGNTVNKGEFSVEVISLILIMKVLYPNNIFLIRGPNEFRELCEKEGFFKDINTLYEENTLEMPFVQMFNFLPVAAVIDKKILCVNGGFGPNITDMNILSQLKRPISTFSNPILAELFWSDPTDALPMFLPSSRGFGILFGEQALDEFLKKIRFSVMIRGHQLVNDGVEPMFEGKLYTVFSASRFCNTNMANNKSGVINIKDASSEIECISMEPLGYLVKKDVLYALSENENQFVLPPAQSFMNSQSSNRFGASSRMLLQNGFRMSTTKANSVNLSDQKQIPLARVGPKSKINATQKSVSRMVLQL